jgi:exopolyphosphatase/guanosine-5'-triphosphate,3'-diphosphate pyrophosphatase
VNWHRQALRLSVLLRVAVLLNRSRVSPDFSGIDASADEQTLRLNFPTDWLEANPLTVADLSREQLYLREIGYALEFR